MNDFRGDVHLTEGEITLELHVTKNSSENINVVVVSLNKGLWKSIDNEGFHIKQNLFALKITIWYFNVWYRSVLPNIKNSNLISFFLSLPLPSLFFPLLPYSLWDNFLLRRNVNLIYDKRVGNFVLRNIRLLRILLFAISIKKMIFKGDAQSLVPAIS